MAGGADAGPAPQEVLEGVEDLIAGEPGAGAFGTRPDCLPATAWQRQSAGPGAKGPRYYDWALVETGTSGDRHLLIRRNLDRGELACYLCWPPNQVPPLSELVRVAGTRWCIDECFQAAKDQVGLDHYQVRRWTA